MGRGRRRRRRADAGEPGGAAAVPLPLAPATWRGLLRRDGLPDDQLAAAILADRRVGPPLPRPGGARRADARRAGRRSRRGAAPATTVTPTCSPPSARASSVRDGRGGGAGRRGRGGAVGAGWWARAPGRRWRSCWRCSRRTGDAGPSSTTRWPASTRRASASRSGCTGRRARRAWARCSRWRRSSTARAAWWHPEGGAFKRPEADAARLLREVRVGSDGTLAPPAARVFWEAVFDGGRGRRVGGLGGARCCAPRAPADGRVAGGARSGRDRRRRGGCGSSSCSSPSGSSARRGRGRVCRTCRGGARASRRALPAARARAHRHARPRAVRGRAWRSRAGPAAVGSRGGAAGPRGASRRARGRRSRPLRAHARPRLGRAPARGRSSRCRGKGPSARGRSRPGWRRRSCPSSAARCTARSRRASRRPRSCERWPATAWRGAR